jgi:hypothetical protein
MSDHAQLKALLKTHLAWHGARLAFLSSAVLALLIVGTVSLPHLALAFPGPAKVDSHVKRLKRFFDHYEVSFDSIARLVVALLGLPPEALLVLTLDRTNWKFGAVSVNILTLGIAWNGTAIPLFWTLLVNKGGNSATRHRIEILQRFIGVFGAHRIECLVADREFVGKAWFAYLLAQKIRFRIRIKADARVGTARGQLTEVKNLFRSLPVGYCQTLSGRRRLWGHELYIIGLRLDDGQYLILATQDNPESALDDYRKRWGIETLFGSLKTRGFQFESTHMTDPARIAKLIAILATAFTWACRVGHWLHGTVRALRYKKHGRLEKSLFRYGYDALRHCLLNLVANFDTPARLGRFLAVLSGT